MLLHDIVGDSVVVVGLLEIESKVNALCVGVAKTEGVVLFLDLPVCSIVIHSFVSSIFLISSVPGHCHSVSESPLSVYPPNSAVNLWWGLNVTSSSSQIDLKR